MKIKTAPKLDMLPEANAGLWCTPDVLFSARSFKLKVTDTNAFNERILNSSILVVDDNEANALLVKQILESAGFKSVFCETQPGLVVTRVRALKPDLIALDLQMLEVSGLEIMEILEAEVQSLHEGPLLVLTADTTPETKRRALELGADDYLTKPVDVSELCIRVSNLLAGYILRNQLESQNIRLQDMVAARTAELEQTNKSLEVEMAVRKEADTLLRHAEQRLRFLLTASPNTIFSTNAYPPYHTTFVSENIYSLLGYRADEFNSHSILRDSMVHPDDRQAMVHGTHILLEKGACTLETRRLHKDKTYRWIQSDVAVILDSEGNPSEFVGSWSDISDRKANEEALAKTATELSAANMLVRNVEQRLRFLLTSSPNSIFSADPNPPYGMTFISANVESQLGYSPEDFTNDPDFWIDHVHPEDAASIDMQMPLLLSKGHYSTECRFRHKDGAYRWMRADRAVILDSDGNPTEVIGSWMDISDRKRTDEALAKTATELSAVNARLQEFDKLKSDFVSTASHEMRTPLTVIREFADLLSDGIADSPEEQSECYEAILRNCDRLTGMLDYFLDFQKIEAGKLTLRREKVNTEDALVRCYKDLLPKCTNHKLAFNLELSEKLPFVLADEQQMMQVLVNLIGNAVKFTPEGGTLTLRAAPVGEFVQISILDTGRGIAPDNLASVFEAFRQVDRVDGPGFRGTGLGLTISNRIVKMHEGDIWVESTVGTGTKFSFTLPQWTEIGSLEALADDKLEDSEGPIFLLLAKASNANQPRGVPEQTLIELAVAMKATLRAFDNGTILPDHNCVAFVMECDLEAMTGVLERLSVTLPSQLTEKSVFKFHVIEVTERQKGSESLFLALESGRLNDENVD